ncbi:CelD/BcsL family acetyltransferase involved in cellulose biosynthesis [Streptosporangium becharense]|uniref:CelD/BcsL family acetyltransferase involved in cellulose biosynthesis n=1 Tax=Streptosporangium becharense TaxID=1816182 RepID=A0A7W9IKW8_9ACTN|nr:GNAT family N-acetyltransferase [Streptosporangium becharense]MBB2911548.1 CelD/BcsL family acetyltransferase involved in cellulose biosynthesis [Streptosporangium becharense]MBB5822634.1 CelD/BcsL family acetyltransferase involved in cellulose biosynthesis [Streptosporangium becharense]
MTDVSVIRPSELGPSEIDAWREMQRAQPHLANPFLSPEFTIGMGEVSGRVRVAVIQDGEGIVGFFPYEERSGVATAVGAWVSLCQGLIHRPGADFDLEALMKACGLHVWEFGCLVVEQPWFGPFTTVSHDAAVMDLSDGYPAYIDRLTKRSPKFMKTMRYKERKLGREAGEVSFVFAEKSEDQLRLVREWKSAQYARMGRADRFGKTWVVRLVERLHAIDTKDFGGVLSVLYAGGKPVAGHFGLRSDSVLVNWFPAYDPAYGKYSPGIIQHFHMADEGAKIGINSIDLSVATGYEYKRLLSSRNVPVGEGIVRRRTGRAAAHWARTEPVRRVRQRILDSPRLYSLADRTLQWYGQRRSGKPAE